MAPKLVRAFAAGAVIDGLNGRRSGRGEGDYRRNFSVRRRSNSYRFVRSRCMPYNEWVLRCCSYGYRYPPREYSARMLLSRLTRR